MKYNMLNTCLSKQSLSDLSTVYSETATNNWPYVGKERTILTKVPFAPTVQIKFAALSLDMFKMDFFQEIDGDDKDRWGFSDTEGSIC